MGSFAFTVEEGNAFAKRMYARHKQALLLIGTSNVPEWDDLSREGQQEWFNKASAAYSDWTLARQDLDEQRAKARRATGDNHA